MHTDIVLKRPIITEKTMQLVAHNKFTFEVSKKASKTQIAQVVKDFFKVDVTNVATTRLKGKTKKFGRKRLAVSLSDSKKAIVELKPGQTIDLFDIEEDKSKKKK